jgi:hypothetical protein
MHLFFLRIFILCGSLRTKIIWIYLFFMRICTLFGPWCHPFVCYQVPMNISFLWEYALCLDLDATLLSDIKYQSMPYVYMTFWFSARFSRFTMEIFRNVKNWALHIYAWNFAFTSSSSRRTSSSSMARLPAA